MILLLYLFVFHKGTKTEEESTKNIPASLEQGMQGSQAGENAPSATKPAPVFTTPANQEEIYLKQLARMFVERYASYSNQNDNKHIDDVLLLATSRMGTWLKKQAVVQSTDYYGVTTKVIASSIKEMEKGQVKVQVDTQQEVQKGNSFETTYRSGTVDMVKLGSEWKVDGLYWE